MTTDRGAITSLVRDLHAQIDQLPRRGIRDSAGNPYNPSYYKRGLKNAVNAGGLSVADFVRGYLYKAPTDSFKKLEAADSLDLACEALVADDAKEYAHLFTDDDRAAARKRLAPYVAAIEARKAAVHDRISAEGTGLPDDLAALRELALAATAPEQAAAINRAITVLDPSDAVALNRLGRAYEALGANDEAVETFTGVLAVDPDNAIAKRRLREIQHRREG